MNDTTRKPGRFRGRLFAIIAITVAAAAFLVITAGGIGKNLVYYWGPSELRSAGPKAVGATIRLGGLVRTGSVAFNAQSTDLQFDVTDGRATVHVKSTGVPPQMFREGIGVVVEGTMNPAGYFESNRLMVSHNNEYRAPGDREKVDTRKLMSTTKGIPEQGEAP
ncbi:MAG: cytochrome c maturation protein CcmE [Acidobacteriota bacterium]